MKKNELRKIRNLRFYLTEALLTIGLGAGISANVAFAKPGDVLYEVTEDNYTGHVEEEYQEPEQTKEPEILTNPGENTFIDSDNYDPAKDIDPNAGKEIPKDVKTEADKKGITPTPKSTPTPTPTSTPTPTPKSTPTPTPEPDPTPTPTPEPDPTPEPTSTPKPDKPKELPKTSDKSTNPFTAELVISILGAGIALAFINGKIREIKIYEQTEKEYANEESLGCKKKTFNR